MGGQTRRSQHEVNQLLDAVKFIKNNNIVDRSEEEFDGLEGWCKKNQPARVGQISVVLNPHLLDKDPEGGLDLAYRIPEQFLPNRPFAVET